MADDFRPVTPEIMRALARADFDRNVVRELPPKSAAAFDYNEEYDRCAEQMTHIAIAPVQRVDAAQVSA